MVRDVPLSNRRRDITAVVFLGLIGVGIPLWLAASAGAIGLPTIDDWVYMRGAENLFRDGRLVMGGHSAASIGQLLLVQPLLWVSGGDPWAFTAFGLVMTFVGLAATTAVNPGIVREGLLYGGGAGLLGRQAVAVLAATAWAFCATWLLAKAVNRVLPLRVSAEQEQVGLDQTLHAETAYDFGSVRSLGRL